MKTWCAPGPTWCLPFIERICAAGADILETNSFGGAKMVLAEYGLENDAHALNIAAARLARQAADEFSTSAKPRFVAGAMGPTTKAICVTGGVTFPQLVDNFYEQAKALMEGGVGSSVA